MCNFKIKRPVVEKSNSDESLLICNIKLFVQGALCNLLVDTGSPVSIIKNQFVDRNLIKVCNEIPGLKGITGHNIPIVGEADLNLGSNEQLVNAKQKFIVCNDKIPLQADGILGTDFLEVNKGRICFENNLFKLWEDELPMCESFDGTTYTNNKNGEDNEGTYSNGTV